MKVKINNTANELIVEIINCLGRRVVVGEAFINRGTIIDEDVLESIWNLANWGCNYKEAYTVAKGCIYQDRICYCDTDNNIVYVPLKRNIDTVNDNIIIREHYNHIFAYSIICKTWRYDDIVEILRAHRR